jgi:NADH-quinone oxidoreductase subunit L
MNPTTLAALSTLTPLAIACFLMLAGPVRRSGKAAAILSVSAAIVSFGCAITLLLTRPAEALVSAVPWITAAGETIATMGLTVDGVSASMAVVVTGVAAMVQIFSLEYMREEPPEDYGRYFTWQSLFLFSMLGLVFATDLLQLFVAWELVGLCSYLLIGFYYKKASAARAALKAFWMTKFADIGLLVGLLIQFTATGSFAYDAAAASALAAAGGLTATLVAGGYFLAVMGKSAQFPLHIWLPDAMEGPTPVSALLHAATMVAAGVYLIVRAMPIFEIVPNVLTFMAIVGGFTAIFAAIVAIVQTDIKKVLAYSTCSQLGYMVAALGAGDALAGYFHLTTHAAFKALLFLGAGSVIHAIHSNKIADMGGLFKKMPITSVTFIIASLALAGAPLFSGFTSKDLILEALFHGTSQNSLLWFPFIACMITVGLTAFYMARLVIRVFFGTQSEHAAHAHESGLAMTLPLVLLAIPAVLLGRTLPMFAASIGSPNVHFSWLHITPVGGAGLALALLGLLAATSIERAQTTPGWAKPFLHIGTLARSGAVDSLWANGYRKGLLGWAATIAWFDRYVIDGLMNLIGAISLNMGERVRKIQTGSISDYLFAISAGVTLVVILTQMTLGGL